MVKKTKRGGSKAVVEAPVVVFGKTTTTTHAERAPYLNELNVIPMFEELKSKTARHQISTLEKVGALSPDDLAKTMMGEYAFTEVMKLPVGEALLCLVKEIKVRHMSIRKKIDAAVMFFPGLANDVNFEDLALDSSHVQTFFGTLINSSFPLDFCSKARRGLIVNFLTDAIFRWKPDQPLCQSYPSSLFTMEALHKFLVCKMNADYATRETKVLFDAIAENTTYFIVLYAIHAIRDHIKIGYCPDNHIKLFSFKAYYMVKEVEKMKVRARLRFDSCGSERSESKNHSINEHKHSSSPTAKTSTIHHKTADSAKTPPTKKRKHSSCVETPKSTKETEHETPEIIFVPSPKQISKTVKRERLISDSKQEVRALVKREKMSDPGMMTNAMRAFDDSTSHVSSGSLQDATSVRPELDKYDAMVMVVENEESVPAHCKALFKFIVEENRNLRQMMRDLPAETKEHVRQHSGPF